MLMSASDMSVLKRRETEQACRFPVMIWALEELQKLLCCLSCYLLWGHPAVVALKSVQSVA